MTATPRATRPRFGEYGIREEAEGILAWSWAVERLLSSRNFWISTAAEDGRPHAMPVWGVWVDEALWFGTAPSSRKGRNLVRDPRVVAHVESGDEAVILEGEVERAADAFGPVADAFESKYDWRPRPEQGSLWFALRPRFAWAWLERDYGRSATRFDF